MHTLILGLDGLDYNLLKTALPNMPFFSKLVEESAWGMMRPDIALSPQSWSTIFTGVNERKHKVASFHTPLSRVHVPTLWSILNSYDRTVGVFNVPLTFPPAIVKGYMVAGYPAPYPASEPAGIVTGSPPVGEGRAKAWERHGWAWKEGARLAIEHAPWCAIIATNLPDEFGHGHETTWTKGLTYLTEIVYPRLDKDVDLLVAILKPTVLAIFSDHGWNSEVYSSTLYEPWHEGATDKGTKKPVERADWAYHTKEAVGFFKGPNVKAERLPTFSNRDFLPTMLDIWNLPSGLQFDGASVVNWQRTAEEAAAVKERLKALGYV